MFTLGRHGAGDGNVDEQGGNVLTQMPTSELLVPSWFDGVENVFETYKVQVTLGGL